MKKPIFLPLPPEVKTILLFILMWVVIFGLLFLSAICTGCSSASYTVRNDSVKQKTVSWEYSKDIPDSTKNRMIHVFGISN